jgi:hypothetical protein
VRADGTKELVALADGFCADLKAVSPAPAPASPVPLVGGVPAVGHASSTAILGDCKRRGVWQVPAHAATAPRQPGSLLAWAH